MAADIPEKTRVSPAVAAIIAELKSEYGSLGSAYGPLKSLNGMELSGVFTDIAAGRVTGRITISAYHESNHSDAHNGSASFDVTLDDVKTLAVTAPRWRDGFAQAALALSGRLEADRRADQAILAARGEQGLPLQQPIRVMAPLRLRLKTR